MCQYHFTGKMSGHFADPPPIPEHQGHFQVGPSGVEFGCCIRRNSKTAIGKHPGPDNWEGRELQKQDGQKASFGGQAKIVASANFT
jgi:hypothetical protein